MVSGLRNRSPNRICRLTVDNWIWQRLRSRFNESVLSCALLPLGWSDATPRPSRSIRNGWWRRNWFSQLFPFGQVIYAHAAPLFKELPHQLTPHRTTPHPPPPGRWWIVSGPLPICCCCCCWTKKVWTGAITDESDPFNHKLWTATRSFTGQASTVSHERRAPSSIPIVVSNSQSVSQSVGAGVALESFSI